jgi:hypothetical protein
MSLSEPEGGGGEPRSDQPPAPQRDTRHGIEQAERKQDRKSAAQTDHAHHGSGGGGNGTVTHR